MIPALSVTNRTWFVVRSSTSGTGQPVPCSTTSMRHGSSPDARSAAAARQKEIMPVWMDGRADMFSYFPPPVATSGRVARLRKRMAKQVFQTVSESPFHEPSFSWILRRWVAPSRYQSIFPNFSTS